MKRRNVTERIIDSIRTSVEDLREEGELEPATNEELRERLRSVLTDSIRRLENLAEEQGIEIPNHLEETGEE